MGCFDGAELCETIGIYILTKLQKVFQKDDAGLYRDDGLGVMKDLPGPEMERKRKQIIKIFKKLGLSITIKMNSHVVDFLDVQFNLKTNSYKAYMKPNNEPVYINKNSNHPPQVLKELPKTIEKRISNISSSKEIFDTSKPIYEKTLNECGFQHKLLYQENVINNIDDNQEKKKRKRNIIWYNPPYSVNVKMNIGKLFFRLSQKHFPKTHKFYKTFNKNCVKLSYSSMCNIASIISSHNKSVLRPIIQDHGCNCRQKNDCPIQNKCLTPNIVYEATVTNNVDTVEKIYFGLCEISFKKRYSNHTKSFRLKRYNKETELSKYVWELKRENKTAIIKWRILRKIHAKPRFNFCKLCLMEKLYINNSTGDERLLNKKSEFVNKCRHQDKLLLKKLSLKDRSIFCILI